MLPFIEQFVLLVVIHSPVITKVVSVRFKNIEGMGGSTNK